LRKDKGNGFTFGSPIVPKGCPAAELNSSHLQKAQGWNFRWRQNCESGKGTGERDVQPHTMREGPDGRTSPMPLKELKCSRRNRLVDWGGIFKKGENKKTRGELGVEGDENSRRPRVAMTTRGRREGKELPSATRKGIFKAD